ncbi:MAG: 7-cyano-7-deazaguanine synthase [Litorilinea sp.]
MSVNFLWTGGWDSTFRLLQLLLDYGEPVTPYYLIDTVRRSTAMELQTMRRIKERLWADYPQTRALIRPAQFAAVEDIAPVPELSAAYQQILTRMPLGTQYEWLARFCQQRGIEDMELSIERETRPWIAAEPYIQPYTGPGGAVSYCLNSDYADTPEYVLFARFRYPLFEMTKVKMGEHAQAHGWRYLLELTWFCHRPTWNGTPCGLCEPCRLATEEGMAHRVPPARRAMGQFYRRYLLPFKPRVRQMLGRR